MKTSSELALELEIINSSPEFVADFSEILEKKTNRFEIGAHKEASQTRDFWWREERATSRGSPRSFGGQKASASG
jgi:hypothetical protein